MGAAASVRLQRDFCSVSYVRTSATKGTSQLCSPDQSEIYCLDESAQSGASQLHWVRRCALSAHSCVCTIAYIQFIVAFQLHKFTPLPRQTQDDKLVTTEKLDNWWQHQEEQWKKKVIRIICADSKAGRKNKNTSLPDVSISMLIVCVCVYVYSSQHLSHFEPNIQLINPKHWAFWICPPTQKHTNTHVYMFSQFMTSHVNPHPQSTEMGLCIFFIIFVCVRFSHIIYHSCLGSLLSVTSSSASPLSPVYPILSKETKIARKGQQSPFQFRSKFPKQIL